MALRLLSVACAYVYGLTDYTENVRAYLIIIQKFKFLHIVQYVMSFLDIYVYYYECNEKKKHARARVTRRDAVWN